MTDKEKLEKLIAEIERRITFFKKQSVRKTTTDDNSCALALQGVLCFYDSMQEEPASEEIWEASKQYALRQVLASTDTEMSEQAYLGLRLFSGFELAVAHKEGAKWKEEKLMKNAVECEYFDGSLFRNDLREKYRDGDKVKIVIVKSE